MRRYSQKMPLATVCLCVALLVGITTGVGCSCTPLGDGPILAWDSGADRLDAPNLIGAKSDVPANVPPDLCPEVSPDVRPEVSHDLPSTFAPDLAPDLPRDLLPDLRPDFTPDRQAPSHP